MGRYKCHISVRAKLGSSNNNYHLTNTEMAELAIFIIATLLAVAVQFYWIEVKKIDLEANDKQFPKFPSHIWNGVIRVVGLVLGGLYFEWYFVIPAVLVGTLGLTYLLNWIRPEIDDIFHLGEDG